MRSLSSLIACFGIAAAKGFRDTSPFLLFSTSEILISSSQITQSDILTSSLEYELSKCPTDIYVLAHQPGVHASDYSSSSAAAFPDMKRYFTGDDKRIRSVLSVSQVIGKIDGGNLRELLETKCGAGSMHLDVRSGLFDLADEARPRVITINMNELPIGEGRKAAAHINELYLDTMMDMLPTDNFTVLYTTSPVGEPIRKDTKNAIGGGENIQYEMDHADGFVHMELRRDFDGQIVPSAAKNGSKVNSSAPLFEKYQFLTPGLFMGFLVSFTLLSILFVGVKAIAGMEVSYAAFDKENGPQAQKKQQ